MHERQLPNSDLRLSVIGFGCWAIGKKWWGDDVDDDASIAALRAALDLGINWFDTAPLYGLGHSDDLLVRALGPRLRDVIVATKVGVRTGSDGHAHSELGAAHVRADAEASLRRLGKERIDLLQIHWPCELATPLPETMGALADLVKEGKVRHVGVCNYDADGLRAAAAAFAAAALERGLSGHGASLVSLQSPYSLLRRELERSLRPAAAGLGLGVLAYEPLCRGLLTGKFHGLPHFPDTDLRSRDERFAGHRFLRAQQFTKLVVEASKRVGTSPAALAVGWVCAQPGITAAIAGAKSAAQIRESAAAADLLEHTRLWDAMNQVANAWRG